MSYAIELSDVTKIYNGFTLDHINLNVPTGCIMGFVGENGAGKSTTIKLILNLIKKNQGQVKVLGKDVSELSMDEKELIGVVMDTCCFPEVLNATDIGKISKKMYRHWDQKKYDNYLKEFNIPDKKAIKDFSKGMKMKLNISCALSHGAKLLVLDEATSGLDPVIRDEILDIFQDFIQDDTNTVFISSHITSDLEKICDYITLIHKGKLVFSEMKDELKESYGVLKCSEQELRHLPSNAVIRYRKNQFGIEALVKKTMVSKQMILDPASIEDIMLFNIRG